MLAGASDVGAVIDTLHALRGDSHPAVLRRIVGALSDLERLGTADDQQLVGRLARGLVEGRSSDDPEVDSMLLRIAGVVGGDRATIRRARELDVVDSPDATAHAEIAAATLEIVATWGDESDFDRIVSRFRGAETPPEEQRFLAALARFGVPSLQDRLFEMCFGEIRTQNAPYTLAQAMGHPRLGYRAWGVVRDRWEEVVARFPSNSIPRMIGAVRNLWDPEVATDAIEFLADRDVRGGERTIAQYLDVLRAQQRVRPRQLDALRATLG